MKHKLIEGPTEFATAVLRQEARELAKAKKGAKKPTQKSTPVPFERNTRYFAKHGYGFGRIGCHIKVLRSLTVDQIDAIVDMILHGDTAEIALDEDTVGAYATGFQTKLDEESETKLHAVAALVYATNHLATDIPTLQPKMPIGKPVHIWNGRANGFKHAGKPVAHFYAAAHSKADLIRLLKQVGYTWGSDHEITTYWHKNCWGNAMDGIIPKRGIWVTYERDRNGKPHKGAPVKITQ